MNSKDSFSSLGQESTNDMNIDQEVSSINSSIYTPSFYHSPTFTTRILLETPPPPTISRPPLDRFATIRKSPTNLPIPERLPRDRFATTRKSPTNLPIPERPLDRFATTNSSNLSSIPSLHHPLDRFATTNSSNLSSIPSLHPPLDQLIVTNTPKQNTKKTGGIGKIIPSTQYGGSPQDDFFRGIKQLLSHANITSISAGYSLTTLEKFIKASPPIIDINAMNDEGLTALLMLVCGPDIAYTPLKKMAKIAHIRVELVKLLLENGALIGAGRAYELFEIAHNELFVHYNENDSSDDSSDDSDSDSDHSTIVADHLDRRLRRRRGHRIIAKNRRMVEKLENARLKIAEILLNYGSINKPMTLWHSSISNFEESYRTPLHYAVEKLDIPYVKLLLERGANLLIKNAAGKTPLMLLRDLDFEQAELGMDEELYEERSEGRRHKIESMLLNHYAKRNTKKHLVDQMGPPNMKDLQKTTELPRGSRIKAEPNDYPFFYEESSYPLGNDGDGVIRKNIKSYLGGKKTRRLRRRYNNKRTLTKDKQDEKELDQMECIAKYPYNDESSERMKHCLKN